MKQNYHVFKPVICFMFGAIIFCFFTQPLFAASGAEIDKQVDMGLKKLYKTSPEAKKIAAKARAILVFPKIVKGGMVIGGQYGEGALRINGKTVAYYSSTAASIGYQAVSSPLVLQCFL